MKGTLLVAGCLALLPTALAGSAGDGRALPPPTLTLDEPRYLGAFPPFEAGDRIDDLPLTAVLRRDDTAELVSFVYGDCTATAEAGCAPPIEVQVWPACRRHLGLYRPEHPWSPRVKLVTVRGVPGAVLDEGRAVELQTGRSTIVVFAESYERAVRVVRALRPLGARTGDGALPPPVPGATEGRIEC